MAEVSPQPKTKIEIWLVPFLVLVAAIIFGIDLVTPLGMTVTIPYVSVVLVSSLFLPRPVHTIVFAAACSVLTVIGFFYSPPGSAPWVSVVDRSLVLLVIWETTILSLLRKQAESALRESHDHLEQRVHQRTTDLATLVDALHDEIENRKNTEAALRTATEAAETASRAKSDFVATISHELRTPLNAIIGYNDLLLEAEFGPLTETQRDALQHVEHNASQLLDLVNAVLDLNRMEAGRMPMNIEPVRTADVLKDIEESTRLLCQQSGLKFVWTVEAGLPVLHTDAAKLKLVLRNLIANAMRFTPNGQVTVTAARRSGGVEISVSDTGIGIPRAAFDTIFEPFRQLDSSSTRRYSGTGLGLHIVKRYLALLGGTVSVDSEVGRGSTFRVWVPETAPQGDNPGT